MTDDWRPSASPAILARRAQLLKDLRGFMESRAIMEVETPVLSPYGNPDPALQSLVTRSAAGSGPVLYLHTSPEFAMKRLLAAGSGSIYQLVRVFRDDERGRYHQPEFTLLEWYRVGFDHHALMNEIDELLAELGLPAAERVTYGEVFRNHTGLDPHDETDDVLMNEARSLGLSAADPDRHLLLDFLFSHRVGPHLGLERPCFVYDYPAGQAALARVREDPTGPRAERFELFINSMEIANGYNELTDYYEQESRFEQDRRRRGATGLPGIPADPRLLAALRSGLPECAGVALGVDRLLMILTGAGSLDEVMAFPLR